MIKKLRVTVEGKAYEVEVEVLESSPAAAPAPLHAAPASAPAAAPAPAAPTPAPSPSTPPKPAAASAGDVPSPLAGRVVAVQVNIGDTVESGAQLLTLEAMKMNTFVFAPRPGTVAAIHVKPGDAVEEAQALITLT